MVASLKVVAQQEIEFDFGACVTIDSMQAEKEFNAKLKARYYCESGGGVCVTSIWVHDIHDREYGGLAYWKAFHFPRSFVRQVEHAIEDGFRKIEERER